MYKFGHMNFVTNGKATKIMKKSAETNQSKKMYGIYDVGSHSMVEATHDSIEGAEEEVKSIIDCDSGFPEDTIIMLICEIVPLKNVKLLIAPIVFEDVE